MRGSLILFPVVSIVLALSALAITSSLLAAAVAFFFVGPGLTVIVLVMASYGQKRGAPKRTLATKDQVKSLSVSPSKASWSRRTPSKGA